MASLSLKELRDTWHLRKGLVLTFVAGMLVGPFVSSYFGVQVTSRNARAELHNGIVDVKASICNARARIEVKEPGKLDWSARRELAAKFAIIPGFDTVDPAVASLCSDKLAS
jgi:hypothetical protein